MSEQLKEVVVLSIRDISGQILGEEQIPLDVWYDGLHPLIDDSAVRKDQGVRSIEGIQLNSRGDVSSKWRVEYDAEGRVKESTELPIS